MAFNINDDELNKLIQNAQAQQQAQMAAAQAASQQAPVSQMQLAEQAAAQQTPTQPTPAQLQQQVAQVQQYAQQYAQQAQAAQAQQAQAQQQATQQSQVAQAAQNADAWGQAVQQSQGTQNAYNQLIGDIAGEINTANMVKSGKAQDAQTQQNNIAAITQQLQKDPQMLQQAAALLDQRNQQYRQLNNGATDYGAAIQRTVNQATGQNVQIPTLQGTPRQAQTQDQAQAQQQIAQGTDQNGINPEILQLAQQANAYAVQMSGGQQTQEQALQNISRIAAQLQSDPDAYNRTKSFFGGLTGTGNSGSAAQSTQNQNNTNSNNFASAASASAQKAAQNAQNNYNRLKQTYQQQQKDKSARLKELNSALKKATNNYEKDAIQQEIRGLNQTSKNTITSEDLNKAKQAADKAAADAKKAQQAKVANPYSAMRNFANAQNQTQQTTTPAQMAQAAGQNQQTIEQANGTEQNDQKQKKSSAIGAALFNLGQAITSGVGKTAELAESATEALFPGALSDPTVGAGQRVFAEANRQNARQAEQNTAEHPIAGAVGTGVGKAAKTMLEVGALNNVGEAANITQGAAKALQARGVSKEVAQRAANLAWNQTTDNITDTIPQLMQDVQNGKSGKQAAKDILESNVRNLAFNAAGEMLGEGVNALQNRNTQQAIPSIADNARLRGGDVDREAATNAFLNRAQKEQYNIPGFADSAPDGMATAIARNSLAQQSGDTAERLDSVRKARQAVMDSDLGTAEKQSIIGGLNRYADVVRNDDSEGLESFENGINRILREHVGDDVQIGTKKSIKIAKYSKVRNRFNIDGDVAVDPAKTDVDFVNSMEGNNTMYSLNKLRGQITDVDSKYGNTQAMKPVLDKLKKDYNDLEESIFNTDGTADMVQHYSKQLDDDFKAVNDTAYGTVNVKSTSSTIRRLRQNTVGSAAYDSAAESRFAARQATQQVIPQVEDQTGTATRSIASGRNDGSVSTSGEIPSMRTMAADSGNGSISTSGKVNIDNARPTQAEIDAANARSNANFDELVNDINADEAARRAGQTVDNSQIPYMGMEQQAAQPRAKTRGNVDETVDRILGRKDKASTEYTGQAVTNSIYNSGADTEEEYAKVLGDATKHMSTTEKQSVQTAVDRVTNNFDGEVKKYTAQIDQKALKDMQSSDVDEMMIIRSRLNQQARRATDQATKDQLYAQSRQVAKNIDQTLHKGGQILQSARKWAGTYDGAVTTAEGRLYNMVDDALSKMPGNAKQDIDDVSRRIISAVGDLDNPNNVNETMRKTIRDILDSTRTTRGLSDQQVSDLTDEILKNKNFESIQENLEFLSTGFRPIRSETYDRVNQIFDEIQKYDFGSKKYADGEQEAYKLLANDVFPKTGGTFGEKLDSWRYFSMLANPTTHIKNITGNTLFQRMFSVKNNLAATIESAADKVSKVSGGNGIDRTKAVLNRFSDADQSLIKASRQDAYDYSWKELTAGGKFTDAAEQIDRARQTFGNSRAGKIVQWLSDRNSDLLEAEDNKALISQYQTSLASYLKANGKDASIFKDTSDEAQELLSNARAYAINQAKESAFHQDNAFSKWYTEQVNGLKREKGPGWKALGEFLDVAIPFKKTPANILNTTFEYSPAEIVKCAYDIHQLYTHQIQATDFIDDIAKGLTGTAGLGLGIALSKAGVLKLSNGDGDKESAFNTATGIQGSSIKVGNRYINITELAPSSAPLIFGAALAETEGDYKDRLLQGLGAIGDSVTDMTMLSGITDILTANQYSDNSGSSVFETTAETLASNLASQMLPTLGRKIETTADRTSRSTYSDKTGLSKSVDSDLKYLGTKIPGSQALGEAANRSNIPVLQKTLGQLEREPAIDVFGNEKQNNAAGIGGVGGRAISNFVSPVKITKDTSTDAQNGIRDLATELGDNDVFPSTTTQEAKVNGEKLSPRDWTNYQKDKGKIVSDMANEIMGKDFADIDDEEKGELLKSAWDYAKKSTQQKYGATQTKKIQELDAAYAEGGAEGLADALYTNAEKADANNAIKEQTGKDSVSNSDKVNYLNSLSKDEAQKLVDSGAVSRSSGKFEYQNGEWVGTDKNGKVVDSKATAAAKELNKQIDAATGGDNSVTNDDKVNYLNSLSKSDAQKLVDSGQVARSSGSFKYQNGKWVGVDKKGKVANTGAGKNNKSRSSTSTGVNKSLVNAGGGTDWSSKYPDRYQMFHKIDPYNNFEYKFNTVEKAMDTDGNKKLKKSEIMNYIQSNYDRAVWHDYFEVFKYGRMENPY